MNNRMNIMSKGTKMSLHGPSEEAYIRKASLPPIGRIGIVAPDGSGRDSRDALAVARKLPWWRDGASVVGRDARYWVVGAPPMRRSA